MTVVTEKPWKRYCKWGHDTWVHGRGSNQNCKQCQRETNRRRQRKWRTERERMRRHGTQMYLPELRAFREKRGHSIEDVAFFCQNVSEERLEVLEEQREPAKLKERIEIFQAISILDDRRMEEVYAERDAKKRLVRAGLA